MLAASPGERLRTLRELLGLTQKQLQDLSGVSQSWISQVETGDREATDDGLESIATATGTPRKFFHVRPSTVPLDSLRFRKLASAGKKRTKQISAYYGESYRVSEELLHGNYPPPPLPYATSEELTLEDIEEYAMATREALRLAPDQPIPHLTRALERSGVAVAPLALPDLDGASTSLADGHFGVSYWGGLGETALIGYFSGSGDRDRFTLAHEVGHLVLHTFRPRAQDPEKEAHLFAGALLLPYSRAVAEFSERTSLTEFARKKATWGVSIQAMIMRGSAIGNISDTRKRSLFVQLNQRGWRRNEPVEVGREHPLLLWKLLSHRFGPRPYIPGSEELAIQPAILRALAPTPEKSAQKISPEISRGGVIQMRRR